MENYEVCDIVPSQKENNKINVRGYLMVQELHRQIRMTLRQNHGLHRHYHKIHHENDGKPRPP